METITLSPSAAALLGGLFGAMIGSFFNVVIYRMPRGESVVWPPSRCTRCGYRIRPFENIPVLSWILLRGKCKSCGIGISAEYPLVETATAAVAAVAGWFFFSAGSGYHPDFKIALTFLALASIPIFVIDFRHYLIPDVLTYPGMLLGLGLSFMPGGLTPERSLIGAAGSALFLWSIGFAATLALKKDAMGLGDVKLVAMAGALFGLQVALFGLVFASILGCIVGVPMLLLRKLNEHRHIPFGPYICVGVLIAAFYGEPVMDWYMGLLGL